MDTSLKLQLDVKNNAQDLRNYMLDLSNWEEEMKRKEAALNNEKPHESIIPPPRNKIKRSKLESKEKVSNKPKKISGYDYSAWDKFDVEKACAEIDEEDSDKETKRSDETERSIKDEKDEENGDDNNCSDSKNKGNFSLIDEAFYEKEMGNNFVKKEQWNDAINCYTNAISLDSSNAIYYANRSLCFLKLQKFKSAETDATTAIQLDKSYIKAYQRRALARQALGQFVEAKSDYEEILKIEPKNSLARLEISKIEDTLKKGQKIVKTVEKKTFNPKNMFKSDNISTKSKQTVNSSKQQANVSKIIDSSKSKTPSKPDSNSNKFDVNCKTESKSTVINQKNARSLERGDGVEIGPPESIIPKLEVFKPLPDWCKVFHPVNIPPHKRSKKPFKRIDIKVIEKDEDFNVLEEENSKSETVLEKEKKTVYLSNKDENLSKDTLSFNIPKTAIQFLNCWKVLKKDPEKCYSYLKIVNNVSNSENRSISFTCTTDTPVFRKPDIKTKSSKKNCAETSYRTGRDVWKISGKDLPLIFENSLESNFFSELVTFFANDEIEKDPEFIYDYLLGLTKVKRFSSLLLFMSEPDKKCVRKCIVELEKIKSKEETLELYKLYELKI